MNTQTKRTPMSIVAKALFFACLALSIPAMADKTVKVNVDNFVRAETAMQFFLVPTVTRGNL